MDGPKAFGALAETLTMSTKQVARELAASIPRIVFPMGGVDVGGSFVDLG